ncbi:MAG TPA: OmpH family outer membrane protein [Candidatus Sulfotelmatobacter sp.]|nr:OmpH family outer membrane protein [Candidatus Sulfotelmatobacter sp.]
MSKPRLAWHRGLGIAVLSLTLFGATDSLAQAAKPAATQAVQSPLPIAVLGLQQVLRDSAAGKSAAQQVGALHEKYQAEIVRGQEKLRAEQEDLTRQQAVLSPDAFEVKKRAYQRDASDLQQLLQDRNDELDLINKKVVNQIEGTVLAILKQYMPERGISILVDRQSTISYDPAIDVTNDVLQRLDKALPTIKVSEGAAAGRGSAPAKKAPAAK